MKTPEAGAAYAGARAGISHSPGERFHEVFEPKVRSYLD